MKQSLRKTPLNEKSFILASFAFDIALFQKRQKYKLIEIAVLLCACVKNKSQCRLNRNFYNICYKIRFYC